LPIYEYQPLDDDKSKSCYHCRNGFECIQAMSDEAHTACPQCGRPIKRVVSAPNINKTASDPLAPSNLAAKGFTQYRKEKKGVYRKTAGRGPDIIRK
jgi:putative FmdB family regulatory protein